MPGAPPGNLERNTRLFSDWLQEQQADCEEEEREEHRHSMENVSVDESDDNTGKSASLF
jgi:hypothetical protein